MPGGLKEVNRKWIRIWATDITYIPAAEGLSLTFVAVVDLVSRHVLSWKLSNSLDTEFCLGALEMLLPVAKAQMFQRPIRVSGGFHRVVATPVAKGHRACRYGFLSGIILNFLFDQLVTSARWARPLWRRSDLVGNRWLNAPACRRRFVQGKMESRLTDDRFHKTVAYGIQSLMHSGFRRQNARFWRLGPMAAMRRTPVAIERGFHKALQMIVKGLSRVLHRGCCVGVVLSPGRTASSSYRSVGQNQ